MNLIILYGRYLININYKNDQKVDFFVLVRSQNTSFYLLQIKEKLGDQKPILKFHFFYITNFIKWHQNRYPELKYILKP